MIGLAGEEERRDRAAGCMLIRRCPLPGQRPETVPVDAAGPAVDLEIAIVVLEASRVGDRTPVAAAGRGELPAGSGVREERQAEERGARSGVGGRAMSGVLR